MWLKHRKSEGNGAAPKLFPCDRRIDCIDFLHETEPDVKFVLLLLLFCDIGLCSFITALFSSEIR